MSIFCAAFLNGQTINRYGTTTANFLEIGVGSRATSMGDAYVAVANDVSSIYWNPAGLSNVSRSSGLFSIQPWLVDIDMMFAGGALVVPSVGVIGLGITHVDYGEMDVTNLQYQDGTGERFKASDVAATFTFSRKIVSWFSFGASTKYISSKIWHSSASAFAVDLGVLVNTNFFSFTGKDKDGMNIGMSISNYGSKMRYDGIDLINPIDILENENGNYENVIGQFRTQSWELPLIFRLGTSLKPIKNENQQLLLSLDVLHPNNNSESLNLGGEYEHKFIGGHIVCLRGGIKGVGIKQANESELFEGLDIPFSTLTFGLGYEKSLPGNKSIAIDYSYQSIGVLGNVSLITMRFKLF